jgi:transforming growth factor-beta-induced protein
MKTWFKFLTPGIFSLMVLALVTVSITSCNDDDDAPVATQNIVALAQSQSNLSSLVTALTKYPDLVTLLSGSGNFTVFAPTNSAFEDLLETVGQNSIDDLTEDVLKEVLQYHVVTSGAVLSSQLTAGNVVTANGESIAVTTSGGIRLNANTQVVTPDVQATNGVVHIVDQVLVPPSIVPIINTVVEYPYFNKNFTTLIAAVLAADEDILALLLNSTDKTLFAPTNEAFVAAGITTLPAASVLNTVLPYHVIGSEVRAANLPTNTAPANSEVTTLGGKIYISNRGTQGVFINGSTQVTQTDILADNGVVHVINRTLMPPSQTIAQIVTSSAAANPAQFTKLLQALSRTEAASLLATAGNATANLTVFAPTDAAFEASGINLTTVDGNTLVSVLQKHIISAPTTTTGRIFSRDLFTGNAATLNGNVAINATALTVTSGGVTANIVTTPTGLINILGTNGVIHAIDKVLLP